MNDHSRAVAASGRNLQMLGMLLRTAFRAHCTGEMIGAYTPWQIVRTVEARLLELGRSPALLVSEEQLLDFVETLQTASTPASELARSA